MTASSFRFCAIGLGFALGASCAQADPVLTVFDVPGAHGQTFANTVNDAGDITGYYADKRGRHGYIRSADGQYTIFDVAKKSDTVPYAINGAGTVSGWYTPRSTRVPHGFVRQADGAVALFDAPGAGGLFGTECFLISDDGSAAGTFGDVGGVLHGFVRAPDGTITVVDVPGAGAGVNQGTYISTIDANGDTTGYYVTDDFVSHGFVRKAGGKLTTFDVPDTAG